MRGVPQSRLATKTRRLQCIEATDTVDASPDDFQATERAPVRSGGSGFSDQDVRKVLIPRMLFRLPGGRGLHDRSATTPAATGIRAFAHDLQDL
ncbi:hypothetical protein SR870_20980 [Rhodopseudomonas palustris]|uniref:hypothetical protein n=1 Tax=Rhodopseudomonas palustris TaxID=1076 RepID=UPI002ACDC17B|nr:hypothetical protein [Rhodopseudomonas palustris]WQG99124.1 hypothetical protein SR870_20980 [Rhodopseudomonas palustris]